MFPFGQKEISAPEQARDQFQAQARCGAAGLDPVLIPPFAGQPLDGYGGRPDGAAVDAEGCYWVAMFEGQRVLRLSPSGEWTPFRNPYQQALDADVQASTWMSAAAKAEAAAMLPVLEALTGDELHY